MMAKFRCIQSFTYFWRQIRSELRLLIWWQFGLLLKISVISQGSGENGESSAVAAIDGVRVVARHVTAAWSAGHHYIYCTFFFLVFSLQIFIFLCGLSWWIRHHCVRCVPWRQSIGALYQSKFCLFTHLIFLFRMIKSDLFYLHIQLWFKQVSSHLLFTALYYSRFEVSAGPSGSAAEIFYRRTW